VRLEEARELLPLYALDALSPQEERELEAALRLYPQLQTELNALQNTVAGLVTGLPAEEVPEGLEDRVMARLPHRPRGSEPREAPRPTAPLTRRGFLHWLTPALAAALLVGLVWIGSAAWGWVQALGHPDTRVVTLVNAQGQVVGRALVRPDRQTLLAVDLPPPAGGKVYQAWGLGAGPPIPLETFSRRVALLRLPPQATALAVSQEPVGGSSSPTQILALPQN